MSLVMACDYTVRDFDRWWRTTEGGRALLRRLGAHHFVVYRSVEEPNRIFVTLGLSSSELVHELLRSGEFLTWFDAGGVEEIPPLFIGRLIEKLRYVEAGGASGEALAPGSVIIARIMPIEDLGRFLSVVHARRDRLVAAGCRQYWIYQAMDDPGEVMTLQEVDSLQHATEGLRIAVKEFYDRAGVGIYPNAFVGKLVDVVDIEPAAEE